MIKQIFVNLPVKDLQKTKDFFAKLGFTFNPQFTDENAASMVIGENIFAMLITEKFFLTFTDKQITDSSTNTEVINAISLESKEKVDEMADKAIAAGGKKTKDQDYGWMYSRGFEDLDGHLWEVMYMDEKNIPENPADSVPQ